MTTNNIQYQYGPGYDKNTGIQHMDGRIGRKCTIIMNQKNVSCVDYNKLNIIILKHIRVVWISSLGTGNEIYSSPLQHIYHWHNKLRGWFTDTC